MSLERPQLDPTLLGPTPTLGRGWDRGDERLRLSAPSEPGASRSGPVIFTICCCFIAFIAGAYVVLDRLPPYGVLKDAYSAGKALYDQVVNYEDPLQTDLWADARSDRRGVVSFDAGKAFAGYTLYSSGHDAAAYLVDMNGHTVHEWRLPFSQVWDKTSVVPKPRPDQFVSFDKVHLFPNGDLLAVYSGVGDTPWGLGLVKMTKDSKVIWKYLDRVHHDVEVGADGRIYTLTHRIRSEPVASMPQLDLPVLEDFLVILSPNGTVEKKISLLDAMAASPYKRFLSALSDYGRTDPLHTNAAKPIDEKPANGPASWQAGDVLLSFREAGLLAVLDPRQDRLVWAARGPWLGQHDPSLLANGHILLFDNLGNLDTKGSSRVLEIDPVDGAITWQYDAAGGPLFESVLRSNAQRLPNGNTLITESDGGRLIEVTPKDEIAWEYVNPVRAGTDERRIPIVTSGERFAADGVDGWLKPQ
jgi:hypothetical protein